MNYPVYSQEGKRVYTVDLPEELFGVNWNADLVHQVVVSMRSNARQPIAHTLGRSDVSGTGRKPWKQKGTGRARHGSRRSPIWVGGGVAHGPTKDKVFAKKINRKMRAKALASVLSKKLSDQEIIFVDEFTFDQPKTKEARLIMDRLGEIKGFDSLSTKKRNAACIALFEDQTRQVTKKSFSNMGNVSVHPVDSLNPVLLLNNKYLIIEQPKKSLPLLSRRLNGKGGEELENLVQEG